MRNPTTLLAAGLAAASATVLFSRGASALGPIGIEAGAKVGVGSSPIDAPSATVSGTSVSPINPLGLGLGVRGGIVVSGFYGGVSAMYYLGGSQDVAGGSISAHTTMYGLEAGYGLSLLGLVTVRPQVGLGNATFSSSVDSSVLSGAALGSVGASQSNLYIEPGVTGLVSLGLLYAGADINALFFPGLDNSKTAVTIHGQLGIQL
jgi:hypothetical protein